MLLLTAGCAAAQPSPERQQLVGAVVPMAAARTFSVVERDGYRIVDIDGPIVDWAGAARGPRQHVRLVLVPREAALPPLVGDLAGATLVRTPVQRIAVNAGPHEAILSALGVDDRLVAVGGTYSYNQSIRNRVLAGELRKVGYGWHSPPALDVLVAARPDIFLMSLSDLDHLEHLERIQALGIPALPTFIDAETSYMGRVDYVRLVGLLTGREEQAERFVSKISDRVRQLRELAATQPRKPMIWAWHARGDRWGALVRNAEAELVRDAGGINLLQQPDDPRRDSLRLIGSEELLYRATAARCWIVRDDQSPPIANPGLLRRFTAWRERCLYGQVGRMRPEHNAYDYYETAVIRPDLLLEDLITMLHPELGLRGGTYIVPDRESMAL